MSTFPGDPQSHDPLSPAPQAQAPLPPVQPVVRARRSATLVNGLLAVAVAVAIGGVAFAIGRTTAPAAVPTGNGGNGFDFRGPIASGNPGGFGAQGSNGFGGLGGGVSVRGTVSAITADSVTITLASGGTITIGIDGSTTYHEQSAAVAGDVKSGSEVIVQLTGRAGGFGGNAGASPSGPVGTARDITLAAP